MVQTGTAPTVLTRAQALIIAAHPVSVLALTALTTALAAMAAPAGVWPPVLTAPALLAGQLSACWSNDAADAPRDAAARRADKPVAAGAISVRAVWIAAFAALLAALAMSLAIGVATAIILAVIIGANWAYNLGLKSTPADGLTAAVVFGLLPAYAASTLPSHPLPTWNATAATALRGAVLVLVSAPSVLLLLSSSRPWFALAGLSATVPLAVIAARGAGRVPLWAVVGIGAVDAVVFGVGGSALT